MSDIPNLAVGNKSVLVVMAGPSTGMLPSWHHAMRAIQAAEDRKISIALVNAKAIGDTVGDYSIAVAPDALVEFQREKIHEKSVVITLPPEKLQARPQELEALSDLLSSERTMVAPIDWNIKASGPLAVWAMSRLGFGNIYLLGFDGTAHPDVSQKEAARHRIWEKKISHYARAKQPRRGIAPKLYRVWPKGCKWADKDPIKSSMAGDPVIVEVDQKPRKTAPKRSTERSKK